ncbi:MAG: FUSC family protein [Thermoleophilia bacterium]|nr:FUSC family protein [Thermoleophilia bacterium]
MDDVRHLTGIARRIIGPGVGRLSPLGGLRVAVALAGPLAMGLAIDRRDLAILATGAALFTAMVDPGGGYGRHLRVYSAMAAVNMLVTMLALACAGHAVTAGLVMLALGIAAGAVTAWGAVPAAAAPAGLILFIMAQAFMPSPAFWPSVLAVAAGSAWVAIIAVLPWPVAPYAPAELAVANAWMAIADQAGRPDDDRLREVAVQSLQSARDTVASVRSRRQGWSRESARLWATIQAGQRATSLIGTVEDERRREGALPAVQRAMDDVLEQVRACARGVAALCIDPRHPVDTTGLDHAVDRIRALAPDPDGLTGTDLHDALVATGRMRSARRLRRRVEDAVAALTASPPPRLRAPARPRTAHGPTLREALDWRSTGMRHGLRLGVATGISVGAFTALSGTPVIGITHGQWVSIALVGVLRPTLGDSVQVAGQRVIGTALGAVLAMGLLAAFSGSPWVLALAIVSLGAIAGWLAPVNYMWFVLLFTPLSLLLSAFGIGLDAAIASERLIATGVACVAGVLLATFAWPTRSGEQLPGALAGALRAAADDLDAVTHVADAGGSRAGMTELHNRAVVRMDDAARVLQARMAESIDSFSRPDALAAIEATSMQLVRDIGTLGGRIPLDGVAVPGMPQAREAMTSALRQVAGALDQGTAPPVLDHLPAVLDPAHDAVQRMEQGGTAVRGLASTVDMLDTIALSITRLGDEARTWRAQQVPSGRRWWHRLLPTARAGPVAS